MTSTPHNAPLVVDIQKKIRDTMESDPVCQSSDDEEFHNGPALGRGLSNLMEERHGKEGARRIIDAVTGKTQDHPVHRLAAQGFPKPYVRSKLADALPDRLWLHIEPFKQFDPRKQIETLIFECATVIWICQYAQSEYGIEHEDVRRSIYFESQIENRLKALKAERMKKGLL